jgi:hypothetical protein
MLFVSPGDSWNWLLTYNRRSGSAALDQKGSPGVRGHKKMPGKWNFDGDLTCFHAGLIGFCFNYWYLNVVKLSCRGFSLGIWEYMWVNNGGLSPPIKTWILLCVCIELVASRIIYSNLSQYLIFLGLHSYYGTVLLDENKSSVTGAVHDTYWYPLILFRQLVCEWTTSFL